MSQDYEPFEPLELRQRPSLFDMKSGSEMKSQTERAAAERLHQTDFGGAIGSRRRSSRSFRIEDNISYSFVSQAGDNPAQFEPLGNIISPSNEPLPPMHSLMRTKSHQDCPLRSGVKRLSAFSLMPLPPQMSPRLTEPKSNPNDFLDETMRTPTFGAQPSSFQPSGSIFQVKIEESTPRASSRPPLDRFTFAKLVNYLTKFYKCEPIMPGEVDFCDDELAILKSFIRRKYKKRVEPE